MRNLAYELGPSTHHWWLDWGNECCAIVASGPTVKDMNLSVLKDRIHVIAVKTNVDLCPWADVVYGCDAPWWEDRKGLPGYHGLKITYAHRAKNHFPALQIIEIPHVDKDKGDHIFIDKPGVIGSGGNSGFQALNLAVQFGAKGIMLIGFDCHHSGGVHWYGPNIAKNTRNPDESVFVRWRAAYKANAPLLKQLGIDVVNCSPNSTVNAFRKSDIEITLQEWGL